MPHSKIEQKANPFALDANTNVEYDEVRWRLKGELSRLENWKINASKDIAWKTEEAPIKAPLIWKARKMPLAEAGKYFFTGDLVSREELEKEKLKNLEKADSSPEALPRAKGEALAEEDNGDVEELARVSGVSAEEIRKNKYPRRK